MMVIVCLRCTVAGLQRALTIVHHVLLDVVNTYDLERLCGFPIAVIVPFAMSDGMAWRKALSDLPVISDNSLVVRLTSFSDFWKTSRIAAFAEKLS